MKLIAVLIAKTSFHAAGLQLGAVTAPSATEFHARNGQKRRLPVKDQADRVLAVGDRATER